MRRLTAGAAGMVAAALVAIVYAAEVGSPEGILHAPGSAYTDLLITHWPNAHFWRESVWRDHCWPLWNPLLFSGTPFAANPLSGIWYPPNWILLVLPITPGFNLLLVAHLMVGAAGAARLVHRLGAGASRGWAGPLVAGLAWGLAPKTWGMLGAGHVGAVYALGWLPWIAEAAVDQLSSGGRRLCCRLPVLWALQFLADPRLAAYTALLLASLTGWALVGQSRIGWRRGEDAGEGRRRALDLLPWAFAGLLAIGLTAVLWLPMAELLPHTTRAALAAEESAVYSLPMSRLVGLVWPTWGGFHEWMIYPGTGVLWLAVVGWMTRSRPVRWGTAVACCLLVAVALGTNGPLYPLLANLPGVSLLRVPARVWHLVVLCVAVLAGLGAGELAGAGDGLRNCRRHVMRAALVLTACTGLLGLGLAVLVPEPAARFSALWGFAWLVAAVVVSWGAMSGRAGGQVAGIALALIVAVDLVWVDGSLVERLPVAAVYGEDVEVAEHLSQYGGRVYAPSFRPSPHATFARGIRVVSGVDPLQLAEYASFVSAAAGVEGAGGYSVTLPPLPDGADPRTALADRVPDPVLLAMLDVRVVVSEFALDDARMRPVVSERGGDLNVYLNESVIPWPVVVQRVEVVRDLDEALEAIRESRPGEGAVVRGGYALDGPAGYEPATVLSMTPNRLSVEARGPGLLVVSEVMHPGWRAQVDGEDVAIYPANGVLRGVYLTEGEHLIEMTYRPPAVFWGLGLSIASLGGLAAARRWSRVGDE